MTDKQKTIPSRPALGKGLASLLPSATAAAAVSTPAASTSQPESSRDRHPGISMANIDEITANDFQPRKTFFDESIEELSQSIKSNGLIQPLIVRKTNTGYQLIAGERRLRAAKMAGLKQVPIVIRRTTDREALELALIENVQREELNCIETALAYYQLIQDFGLRQEDLAERMGKDRSSVANHLRLLKLPQPAQTALRDGRLSFGHGKVLAALEDTNLLERLVRDTIEKRWSVRELENQIQKIKNLQQGREAQLSAAQAPDAALEPLELRMKNLGKELSTKLSTRVQFRGGATKGKIVITYCNGEDLERLISHMLR